MAGTTETNAIVREVISTSEKQVSKAVFNGYNLTFTVESTADVVKKVEVSGNKSAAGSAPGMINFQGSINEVGAVSFNPMSAEISTEEVSVIINEMLNIKTGTTAV